MILATSNPKVHYIEGLLRYFQCRKSIKDFNHLRESADGNYDNKATMIALLRRIEYLKGKHRMRYECRLAPPPWTNLLHDRFSNTGSLNVDDLRGKDDEPKDNMPGAS
ncbi:Uncharacterized protein Rs2_48701 [Raphanus sativus]|nr:Uncharacterized protein Rs2_48701 [Raphanus sativus]